MHCGPEGIYVSTLGGADGTEGPSSGRAVFATWLPLGGGHLAAMALALLPFAWLVTYASHARVVQLGAGAAVTLFGVVKLLRRRHPRALARIPPTRLAWWSFLMATAHGAGLMLVPFMLGLCVQGRAAATVGPAQSGVLTAIAVAVVHSGAMIAAGLAAAWAVYRYLGLRVLRRAWINLDLAWAASLVVAGAAGVASAL